MSDNQGGSKVLQEVVQMTGLSEEYLENELSDLLGTAGNSVNNLSLDQLRSVLLNYLEALNSSIELELAAEPAVEAHIEKSSLLTQSQIKH